MFRAKNSSKYSIQYTMNVRDEMLSQEESKHSPWITEKKERHMEDMWVIGFSELVLVEHGSYHLLPQIDNIQERLRGTFDGVGYDYMSSPNDSNKSS